MAFQWVFIANIAGIQGVKGDTGDVATTDPRLMEKVDGADLIFSVLDSNGRRTELELDTAGEVPARVLNKWASRMPATGEVLALPSDDWAHFGDSLTDDAVTGPDAWVTKLAALTGKAHYNGGWYGEKAGPIAARQGGLPALVTVTANSIPASGPVAITNIVNSPVTTSTTRSVPGTLAGVAGIIQEATAGNITFTRTTAGSVTACPAGSRFTPDAAEYRNRHLTVWAGRNDVYFTAPNLIVSAIKAQIDFLSPSVKRALVLEIPPSSTEILGTGTRALVEERNDAIRAAFPSEWVAIAAFLRTEEAATAAGISFTTQDYTDISNGITPESFRFDTLHINAAACTAVAYKIRLEAQERGWLV